MKFKAIGSTKVRIAVLGSIVVGLLATSVHAGGFASHDGARWFNKVRALFTAPDVPAMGPAETEAPAPKVVDSPAPAGLPGKGLAQHSMLYIGEGYNKMFLVDKGKIIWTYSTGPGNEYDDVWMLSNGNVLFTRMQYIAEVTPDKKVVWRYDAPPGTEIHACQPIGLDRVLLIENGLPPHLMVVNIRTNAVEVDHVLPAPSTEARSVHPQFRHVRYTAQGTYLVPFLTMGKVVEYDKNFNEVWSYDVPTPWAAIRLKNGNTLITDEHDVKTLEVTPDKKIVWQITPGDLPPQYDYQNSQTATRLANGNTILCSRGGRRHGPQLVEVTRDKKVVWVLQDWTHLGPASAVQILDDPGIPEDPGQSEH
ncbi:MAG TPA: hypothetical protein VGN16_00730 [Acidobacteriaceae bacterium]